LCFDADAACPQSHIIAFGMTSQAAAVVPGAFINAKIRNLT